MRRDIHPLPLVALSTGALYLLLVAATLASPQSEYWTVLVVAPLLVALAFPLLRVASRRYEAPWLLPLAVVGLCLKLVASMARYWTAFVYYGGAADAAGYHADGLAYGPLMRAGMVPEIEGDVVGTPFVGLVTGVVYAVFPSSIYVGYLVFAWIGFWGLFLAVLAYLTAFPDGHGKRYALLVLLLPSMLFWPSGLGKEAWMMLGVGLAMYGVARMLDGRARGALPLALGLLATAMVRPHVTALLVGALLVALVVRPARHATPLTPLVKLVTVGAAVALMVVAIQAAATFVGLSDLDPAAVQRELETANANTSQGGSEFDGAFTTSVTGIPWALVTVVFRPFPYEAGGLLPLLSSLEGLFLLVLLWRFGRPLLRLPRYLRRHPYVTFCLSYVLFYAVVFSGFSNFGILVRQRSLVLPAFLVLVALPDLVTSIRARSDQPQIEGQRHDVREGSA